MEIILGALAAWGLIMLVWTLAGVLLLPLSREIRLTVVVHGTGDAPWLERCLEGLIWLRDSGLVRWNILILDEALTGDAQDRADRLAQDHSRVLVMDLAQLKEWMEAKHDATRCDPWDSDSGPVSE